ncbi:NAD(P)-binding protein [Boletus edulis]|uniref:NAD(P)-binding protein n=1 Tax=Boletus edulis BED1 TaxID=1328754 RepID=A0AAD4BS92_BOLED|nr:NAD(P)-binding protein [Boletus edulis]KAF8438476.1 NAD(P)-binding protein [Boletus edulis BED1]
MDSAYSILRDLFTAAPRFTAESVPDLSGKVALVTGANAGIGKETARVLLTKNAKVWIACRDVSKGEAALKELKELTGKDAHLLKLDLANLKSIKQSVEEFLQRETQLHILFNNAGVMRPPIDMVTADGYDLQFGTNVLGHFYLTKLLLPILISTAKSSPEGTVRVVNTASQGYLFGKLQFDTFMDGPKRKADDTVRLYGQSKTGNIIFSAELHKRYHDQGIISTALHPGLVNTDLKRHFNGFLQRVPDLLFRDVSHGAITQLYAGTALDAATLGGQYLIPWGRIDTPRAHARDPQLNEKLWEWLEEQVAEL